jgi:hypothetical protein
MYGQFVPELGKKDDKYGFVNETEIRLSTGLALLLGVYSFVAIVFFASFTLPMICIGIIWLDFFLKVFFGPQFSLFGQIVKPFVKTKYFVGAVQKRFAWSLGLFLSTFAFLCILIISGFLPSMGICQPVYEMINAKPIPPFMAVPMSPPIIACILCIIFMTSESFFGYCVGCKIYEKLVRWGIMKEIPGQICPGGVCKI